MSPAAPPVAATPGGRAPSFGAPTPDGDWSFRIGGRFSGWETVGIGRTPQPAPAGYSGTALHSPPLLQGRAPFFAGAGATFNLQYGNPIITAYAVYYGRFNAPGDQGYFTPANGPAFGQAYLQVTPEPLGALRMMFRVGAFTEIYGGPGQWGWGIFGPLLAVRGFGETSNFDYDVTPDLRLSFVHGLLAVPGVPANFVRGDYNSWIETGVSDVLQHAHVGLMYKNQYSFRLHYASVQGTDEKQCLTYTPGVPNPSCPILTTLYTQPHDGRFDSFLAEAHFIKDPFGQAGITVGLWNFDHAASVGDGIWWGLDWTQGAREMVTKFLGPNTSGTGKVAAIAAEYDTSLSRLLWYPRNFDGNAPDLRLAIAAEAFKTLETDDPSYVNGSGYYIGTELEYRVLPWLSFTFQGYGESRVAPRYTFQFDATTDNSNVLIVTPGNRWEVFSLSPGIRFHSDWASTDTIQILYSRRFYSSAVDNNPAQPLDHDIVTLGGYVQF